MEAMLGTAEDANAAMEAMLGTAEDAGPARDALVAATQGWPPAAVEQGPARHAFIAATQAYLTHIYWGAREAAVGILAVLARPNDPTLLPLILPLLHDSSWPVRLEAFCAAAALIHPPPAPPPIHPPPAPSPAAPDTGSSAEEVREWRGALGALGGYARGEGTRPPKPTAPAGKPGVGGLARAASGESGEGRAEASEADGLALAAEALRDIAAKNPQVRDEVAKEVAKGGGKLGAVAADLEAPEEQAFGH
ncbi:hypothetical protein T484DRAFT_1823455 [Baffinella frigidus]|nr:hypothetical protein T484DRAFT_1823455 [Cryptophyta sp. CCMP2293]